jgi:hypothetical protein
MACVPSGATIGEKEAAVVNALAITATLVIVIGVALVGLYAFFELSPFAHHRDRYHEPGEIQDSPRLD